MGSASQRESACALARHENSEAQRFAEHVRSKRTLKEIEAMMVESGDVSINMLHPEKCKWLEEISKQILQGDRETRYFAICRFKTVFNGMLATKDSDACTKYASYVLNQTVILEELSRGLREYEEDRKCYLLPKEQMRKRQAGRQAREHVTLFSVVAMYSNALASLALDKRAGKFKRTQLKDIVNILMRNYDAVKLPEELSLRFSFSVNPELQSKLGLARTLFILASAKELGSRFIKTVLQDALSASEYPSLGNDAIATLHMCGKSTAYACCVSPEAARIVFTVTSTVLKTTSDKGTIQFAMLLLGGTFGRDKSLLKLIQSYSAISSCLLAMATTSATETDFNKLAVACLRMTLPGVMKEASSYGEKLHPEELKALEALLAKDELARRRRKEFDSIFGTEMKEALSFGADEGSAGEFKQSAEFSASRLTPSDEPTTFFNVTQSPLRRCARKECNRVETSAKEFKVCGQCRFATYCSEECQKHAWKEGHKKECKSASVALRMK
ncbi:hypothetical protein KFL_000140030 [Klebsormidium nitens]|uniref:MYND-type domain-containing protein n=1 Tax=Klebsormidium nitens TaxID=105231 RepID=A0A1Y1HIZ8_KLENI|nr:hypothetical protein KFL_000140030 [Klebsormidium nitens]|eukprot:GAQ78484.1 hypothetical protein KFL_000140030 [Klebsormidium nitens]